jgi:cytochrome c oxidase subunit 4
MDPTPDPSHAHAVDHDVAHHVQSHVRGYVFVGVGLGFLTLVTVGLSYVNFGTPDANIVVALIVATIKAGLVALIFMHLKSEKWTIYRFLIITIFFAIGLFALTGLAFSDPIRLNF